MSFGLEAYAHGEMIDFVYEQEATWKELPWKFDTWYANIQSNLYLASGKWAIYHFGRLAWMPLLSMSRT